MMVCRERERERTQHPDLRERERAERNYTQQSTICINAIAKAVGCHIGRREGRERRPFKISYNIIILLSLSSIRDRDLPLLIVFLLMNSNITLGIAGHKQSKMRMSSIVQYRIKYPPYTSWLHRQLPTSERQMAAEM